MGKQSPKPLSLLRAHALSFPGAEEAFPWGESVVKVRGKVFVFLGKEGALGISVKLPQSGLAALSLPFAEPTGHGLGKSGWVTASFSSAEGAPVGLLRQWIEESYRAVAPKRLVIELDARAPSASTAVAGAQSRSKR